MNHLLQLSLIMTVFNMSSLCFAGTSLSQESKINKYTGGFIQISATSARQGIYDTGSSNPNHLFSELGQRALQAGFPVRHEHRSTMGYSPYRATIVTLAKTQSHLVELDMDSDLGFSARFIVTSLLPSLSEITMQTDSGAAASLLIQGPLVSALKDALGKLNSKETRQGVLSLNGATQTIYDLYHHGKTDLAYGPLSRPDQEICIAYLN